MSPRGNGRQVVGLKDDPTWYKDAVIYEVRTRSFVDSNGDGVGDFAGLASKLDYLQDLGVTAIWLLPFYPSPGKDDGYDISSYTDVHPEVGTLADFEALLREAHSRGLRVITELVLNHTSDQHPWFQRARRAPPGSPERDFYVWGDSPNRYADARIIFKDFEVSNWSLDREANAYFWHRFYSHQPDLNFENPAVKKALLEVVDFWLSKGVDGLRLDAVPYLYEAEGTNCENLPRTHSFLKELRAHIDSKYKNRMLLAEANQWPEDAAAYFGQGDECHMNFHFPLMPRMFMAIHQEDRFPIIDIFAQTPDVHPTCQWALFLRNHDELTLEMVTDDERDYMYKAYAEQPAMRINLGIRRRLAPLVGNNRRKIELLNGLLFSLPGTPVIYYGDEIGMGDNVYLGDRNGVRTPMQWSLDRNAGFSRANPQRLILPVVIDPEYHYEAINVENQQENPTSLLWWTKRLVALRRRYAAFGRGSIEFLSPNNSRVLAFVRRYEDEKILIIANLSRFAQFAALDLAEHKGATPVELFGRTQFPPIGEAPYNLTLGPHGFYWFSLEGAASAPMRANAPALPAALEFETADALFFGAGRDLLDDALPAYLATREWFAPRMSALRRATLSDVMKLPSAEPAVYMAFVRAEYVSESPQTYCLPLALDRGPSDPAPIPLLGVRLPEGGESTLLAVVDALEVPAARAAVLAFIAQQLSTAEGKVPAGPAPSPLGSLSGWASSELAATVAEPPGDSTVMGRQRESTTVRFGDRWVLKLLRRIEDGISPEIEIGRVLAQRGSELAPRLSGALELSRPRSEPMTVALVHTFVPHESTAWQYSLRELSRYFERALARTAGESCPPIPTASVLLLAAASPPQVVAETMGNYLAAAAQLGERVAELHLTLLGEENDPSFGPETYSALGIRSKYQSLRTLSGKVVRTLRERLSSLPPKAREEALAIVARESEVLKRFEPLLRAAVTGIRVRGHGNLGLQHALYTGKDFVLTDFQGHGSLTLVERRRKRSPLRDLAWMTRSFEFAAYKLLFDHSAVRESEIETARPWAMHWASWAGAAFVRAYLAATEGAGILRAKPEELAMHFDALVLESALYQLRAELDEPSDTVLIPLLGIERILQMTPGSAPSLAG